jgi:hypothetical protein
MHYWESIFIYSRQKNCFGFTWVSRHYIRDATKAISGSKLKYLMLIRSLKCRNQSFFEPYFLFYCVIVICVIRGLFYLSKALYQNKPLVNNIYNFIKQSSLSDFYNLNSF